MATEATRTNITTVAPKPVAAPAVPKQTTGFVAEVVRDVCKWENGTTAQKAGAAFLKAICIVLCLLPPLLLITIPFIVQYNKQKLQNQYDAAVQHLKAAHVEIVEDKTNKNAAQIQHANRLERVLGDQNAELHHLRNQPTPEAALAEEAHSMLMAYNGMKARNSALVRTRNKALLQLRGTQEALVATTTQRNDLQTSLTQTQAALQESRANAAQLQETLARANATIAQANVNIADLRESLARMTQQCFNAEGRLERNGERLITSMNAHATAKRDLENTTRQFETAKNNIILLADEIQRLHGIVDTLRVKADAGEKGWQEVVRLREQANTLNARVKELLTQMDQLFNEKTGLEHIVTAELEPQITALKEANAALTAQLEMFSKELNARIEMNQTNDEMIALLKSQVADGQARDEAAYRSMERMNADLTATSAALEQANAEKAQIHQQAEARVAKTIERAREAIAKIQAEANTHVQALDARFDEAVANGIAARKAQYDTATAQLQTQIDDLRKDFERQRAHIIGQRDAANEFYDQIKAENDQLKAEIAYLQQQATITTLPGLGAGNAAKAEDSYSNASFETDVSAISGVQEAIVSADEAMAASANLAAAVPAPAPNAAAAVAAQVPAAPLVAVAPAVAVAAV